jgi:hypothetical protein
MDSRIRQMSGDSILFVVIYVFDFDGRNLERTVPWATAG